MRFLCIEILNSNRVDFQSSNTLRDMLEDENWMRELLKQWYMAPLPVSLTALNKIKELREQMYSFLTGKHENIKAINLVLKSVSSRMWLDIRQDRYTFDYGYDVIGWDLVLWHIAKSFADMLCNHDQSRIKICDNPDCGWVFYDTSRNKSRRWCSESSCGNLMKVRRFRERQKNNRMNQGGGFRDQK